MAQSSWQDICELSQLTPNTGVCALHQGKQIAIFFCGFSHKLYATNNYDPIGRANVLSRGLMGSTGDVTYVASPLYKQRFDLRSGQCLDADDIKLDVYPIRLHGSIVQLQNL